MGGKGYDQMSRQIADLIEHCVDRLDPKPDEYVLDVATGTGWAARLVAGRGAKVTAIDIAETLVAAARELSGPDIDFRVADAESLPFSDGQFDKVISTCGIPFVSKPEKVVAEAARVLRKGGRLAMTEKLVKREGIGDILAEGVRIAAEKIGRGAEEYAVHAGGQEVGMHDPKLKGHPMQYPRHPTATVYKMDATPGRHTGAFGPDGFERHVNNSMGTCLFVYLSPLPSNPMVGSPYAAPMMKAVTGWNRSWEELLKAGERIANVRHVFTLREGINPVERFVHNRILGRPPQQEGPLAGVSLDVEAETLWNLGGLDWDRVTAKPSRKKLLELGLNDIADELWPPEEIPGFGPPRG